MNTYDRLGQHLKLQTGDDIAMTFDEIERIIGTRLPASAHKRNEWWSNNATGHSQAKAWLGAGFATANLNRKSQTVRFKRIQGYAFKSRQTGVEEAQAHFRPADREVGMNIAHHPAFGAMKGMIVVAPGYDIASSDPEIVAEWEEAIDKKAALIDSGLKNKS